MSLEETSTLLMNMIYVFEGGWVIALALRIVAVRRSIMPRKLTTIALAFGGIAALMLRGTGRHRLDAE